MQYTITHILIATLRNTDMGFRCKAVSLNDMGAYIETMWVHVLTVIHYNTHIDTITHICNTL